MEYWENTDNAKFKLPKPVILGIIAICVLPYILNLLGVDFGSPKVPFPSGSVPNMGKNEIVEAMFRSLAGPFQHTLLEWSAFAAAIFTALLAFAHFRIKRDVVTPIIGVALFWAGCMDAFHTLAADRLIEATVDNQNLIPFTWAICRIFNALIPMTGAIFLLSYSMKETTAKNNFNVVATIGLFFGVLAYGIIHVCATSAHLPETQFPGALITRPYDILPLILFVIAGTLIYPRFNRRYQSYFSHALWVSMIPDISTQIYMAFGSSSLFDNNFNIAHFLKIVSYLVPCIGLLMDYVRTYRYVDDARVKITLDAAALEQQNELLARSNKDLEEFASIASHDLQEPLRKVQAFGDRLRTVDGGSLSVTGRDSLDRMQGAAGRMQVFINDLLAFSRVSVRTKPFVPLDLTKLIKGVLSDFETRLREVGGEVRVGELATLHADRLQMGQLFENLIGNALKFRRPGQKPVVKIHGEPLNGSGQSYAKSFTSPNSRYRIFIEDNGIGFEQQYSERIFKIFHRLHNRGEYEGTGVGLAICRKIVERHGGDITARSTPDNGTTFIVTLPLKPISAGLVNGGSM